MSPDREHGVVRCWECEAETESTVTVELAVPSLGRAIFALCPTCVRNVLAPLVDGRAGAYFPDVSIESIAHANG